MQGFLDQLRGFGVGRLAVLGAVGVGVLAVLAAVMLRIGAEPQALLYANLDPKEAAAVTGALDGAGVKYEVKGDGTTITVPRDKVASSRLLVAGKGLVTSGSVGYEIFDGAPALGQTDFVQTLNRQRALEGELSRTIGAIRGVSSAKVLLNMPKRQLFESDADAQASASIMISSTRRIGPEQVRAIRNLVAGAVPDLKPERVAVADQSGDLLAGAGDAGVMAAGGGERFEVEERIRKTVLNLVEGVVGPGHARVQVTADLDMSRVTTSEEKFDPDGQVVRSTQTSEDKSKESKAGLNGAVSASQNVPGASAGGANGNDSSDAAKTDETTNYEISKTTTTTVAEPGKIEKLSVAVAVDGVTAAAAKGKPGAYSPRAAEEMQRIDQLVRSAVGFDAKRGDQVSVVNVRFDQPAADAGASGSPFSFDKNDILRAAELGVLGVVAILLVLFVLRPMFRGGGGAGGVGGAAGLPGFPALAGAAAGGGSAGMLSSTGSAQAAGALSGPGGQALLAGPEVEGRIDIARIEGQVRASAVKQVADFVEKHPEESVSILRSWLHETG